MGNSHIEIVEKYAKGEYKSDKRTNGTNIFIDDGVLYSYGHHFPLALVLDRAARTVAINKDKYSTSTSKHQSYVRREFSSFEVVEVTTQELQNIITKSRSGQQTIGGIKMKVAFVTRMIEPEQLNFDQMTSLLSKFLQAQGVKTRRANIMTKDFIQDAKRNALLEAL
jgi:hypothetical protein